MGLIRVLAIDDEVEFCSVLKQGLEATKRFSVSTASRAALGLRLAREQKPDVILLDIMMPEMAGTEMAEALQESEATRHIPVIFITALLKKTEEQTQGSDRNHIIAKPVSILDLANRIESVVRG